MKNYTDITVLLDRSRSMEKIKESMQGAFDDFVEGHKVNPETRLTLIQFDDNYPVGYRTPVTVNHLWMNPNIMGGGSGNGTVSGGAGYYPDTTQKGIIPMCYEVVYEARAITAIPKLDLEPRGNTPLIDALVGVLDQTGRRLALMPESERPERVLFVIITDGEENASVKFKKHDVFQRITHQRSVYNWQFIYLGANQDAIGEAQSYGIPAIFASNYTATDQGTRDIMRSATMSSVKYASGQGLTDFPVGGPRA